MSGRLRAVSYHAVHRMFERVNEQAGTSATLHSLRHTAAYRMAEDSSLPLTDVQFVLGHAQLTTTQIYLVMPRDNATTFYDRDRTLQGVFAAARDVTERKRVEAATAAGQGRGRQCEPA